MSKLASIFFLSIVSFGATVDVSTQSDLQTAVNNAACGDKIRIISGSLIDNPNNGITINVPSTKVCPSNNRIKIMGTTKEEWLPNDHTRMTPGHKGNMATIRYAQVFHGNQPMAAMEDGVSGIEFIGLYLKMAGDSANSPMFRTGRDGAVPDATAFVNDIVIDRVYAEGDFVTTTGHGNFIYAKGKSITVKNTMVVDWHRDASETHFFLQDTSDKTSLKLIERNYSSTFSEHIFTGGDGGPGFSTANVGNLVAHDNIWWNSLKWFPGTPNYVGSTVNGCVKNFVEFKDMVGARVYHNSGYNSWQNCGSQFNGFFMSFRPKFQPIKSSTTVGTPNTFNADLSTTTSGLDTITLCPTCVTDSGINGPQYQVGAGICVCKDITCQDNMAINDSGPTNGRWECAEIVTADPVTKVYTVTPPFSNSYAIANPNDIHYARVAGWRNGNSDVVFEGNYTENVVAPYRTMMQDDASYIKPNPNGFVTFVNNFHTDRSPYMITGSRYAFRTHMSNENIAFVNNTHWPDPNKLSGYDVSAATSTNRINTTLYFGGANGDPITGLRIQRNLFSPSAFNTFFDNSGSCNVTLDTDLRITNNALETGSSNIGAGTCTAPRTVSPNLTTLAKASFNPQWANSNAKYFKLLDTSRYYHAGPDGRDLGAKWGSYPVIYNSKPGATSPIGITTTSTTATIDWEVPAILQDEVATLECTTDSDIHTDLGPFTVTNDLNPTMFIRADSNEYNPRATGFGTRNLTWQIGANSTVNDDNGVSRNLALTPNTTYYCRLMQGGTMELFTFTTEQAQAQLNWDSLPGTWDSLPGTFDSPIGE